MRRLRIPLLGPALALITLTVLYPSLATARPQREAVRVPAERRAVAAPSLLSKLRDLLTILWAETGSIPAPDGATAGASSGSGAEPNPATTVDTGSGLDPNG
jgi:hypothetical protein